MPKRVNTVDFIQRACEVHGERYVYTRVLYVTARNKVTIICPEHGEFEQIAANHCTGYGCPECEANLIGRARL